MTEAESDHVYHGRVIRLEPLADFKKNTIQAKVRIEDPGPGLHPEMICRARFLAPREDEPAGAEPSEPTVALAAVVREAGRSYSYLVRGGRARRVELRLGEERGGRVVVESGLSVGDQVVLEPPAGLGEEAAVEVQTP